MAFSNERKITTVALSEFEKHRLASYFGSSNFSKNLRRILNSTPVLIDEQSFGFLLGLGVVNWNDHDEVALAVKEALWFAFNNRLNLQERENLFYKVKKNEEEARKDFDEEIQQAIDRLGLD